MRWWRVLLLRIRSLGRRGRVEAELDEELRFHVERQSEANIAAGMTADEARNAALRQFGGVEQLKEECRDERRVGWIEDFARDLRYALRTLARTPGFTAIAVITLALGIGANTAIFSAVYAVLLRPLPFPDADRLVLVSEYKAGVPRTGSPLGRYYDRAASDSLEQTGAYWDVSGGDGMVFGDHGSAQRLGFSMVDRGFFSVLGVRAEIGRVFTAEDEVAHGPQVFLASDALWRSAMGADPSAIGRTYRLDGLDYTLVGVLPAHFQFPGQCDLWLPVGGSDLHDRLSHQFWIIGRLRSGKTPAQAQAEFDAMQRRLAGIYPSTDAQWSVRVTPLLEDFVGNIRRSLLVLLGAVACVLLIACANVTNLLLSRAVAREREFAIRGALGARRSRLLRQLVAESLLIVAAGAGLGLLLARVALQAIIALSLGSIPRLNQPTLNVAVLLFCALIALLTTLVVSAAPGLHASGAAFAESLVGGERAGRQTRRSSRLGSFLVAGEVAMSLMLLAGAGLMLRTYQRLHAVDPGFRPQGLLTVKVALPDGMYPKTEQRADFLRQLMQRLNATPGITVAAAADRLPLSGDRNWGSFNIVGRPQLDMAHAPVVEGRAVSSNYFRAVGIPLLRGRTFTDADADPNRPAVVINRAMAEKFWPGTDPIGQHITSPYRPSAPPREIIGVVGNVREFGLDAESPPEMYTPVSWWNVMNLVVRGPSDPPALASMVRAQVNSLDSGVAVYGAAPFEELVGRSIARQRFELFLLGLFAAVALILAMIGVYGVLAFAVGRRHHEIGVRLALGASPRRVLALILRQGMKSVLLGMAAGLLASFLVAGVMRSLLFEVSPSDPLTFGAAVGIMVLVALAACCVPARRATHVDPLIALRHE